MHIFFFDTDIPLKNRNLKRFLVVVGIVVFKEEIYHNSIYLPFCDLTVLTLDK